MKLIVRQMMSHKGGNFHTYVFEERAEIRIGRSYDSDLIMSDPFVCAEHLKVRYHDGKWYLQNQSNINGTKNSRGQIIPSDREVLIRSGDKYKIGHSYLKFFLADQEVRSAKRLHDNAYWVNKLDQFKVAFILFLLAVVMGGVDILALSPAKEFPYLELATIVFGVLTIGVVYALIMSLSGLFARTHSYFIYHFSLMQILFAISPIVGIVLSIYGFYAETIMGPTILDTVIIATAVLIPVRMSLMATLKNRVAATGISVLMALLVMVVSMAELNEDGHWGRTKYNQVVVPYLSPLSEAPEIGEFLENNNDLFNPLD